MLRLELPWPPTVNTATTVARGRKITSKKARDYYDHVKAIVSKNRLARSIKGNLLACVTRYPPDRRKRDIDNTNKCLFDSLSKSGVIGDDSQIKISLHADADIIKDGCIVVDLYQINCESIHSIAETFTREAIDYYTKNK